MESFSTALQCAQSGFPSLVSMSATYGNDFTEAYLCGALVNLLSFLNVGKTMNDVQCLETAYLIRRRFWSLNIADVFNVIERAKLGHYGQLYDRIDGQIILDWFNKYFDERWEACANASQREADEHRSTLESSHRAKEYARRTLEKMKAK